MNTMRDVLDAMGSHASDKEAAAMLAILKERGLEEDEISLIPEKVWFGTLIPAAIKRARGPVREAELAEKRAVERAKYNKWADQIDRSLGGGIDVANDDPQIARMNREELFMVEVAAELLRQSKITQIRRAMTEVRKKKREARNG